MPPHPPDDLLDRPLLRQLAGEQRFALGEEYFTNGRVRQLQAGADRITAKVSGSRAYRVKLWRGRGQLQYSCNCPLGREETFCKHCVAVGLAWLAGPEAQATAPGVTRDQLRDHLRSLDKERLLSLTLEATDYDDILRRRLMLETIGVSRHRRGAQAFAAPPDLASYRQILREAIECADYVDYDAMPDYAQGVDEAIRPMADLIKGGYAAAVVELAEFALAELDKSSEMLDGGDGALNAVYDDLQHYHLEACRVAQPDPETLAKRLLNYELEGGLGIFNNAPVAYAEVLGPAGLAAWRRLLIQEWSALPALGPARTGEAGRQPLSHRRFQIATLMERLARVEGDTEVLAAVKQRDLSSAHDFLALAEIYAGAGDLRQAVDWAERGVNAFPDSLDAAGLREFLAGAYHDLGRHDEAMDLVWQQFERTSDVEHYQALLAHAGRTGRPAEVWHERALAHLRRRIARERKQSVREGSSPRPDHSALVEILLSQGRDEEAWAEASAGDCRPHLWLQLAQRREKQHPDDALKIYREQLGPTIARGEHRAYREAVALMARVRALLATLGRAAEFGPFRAEIRAAHRQKRNFLKLLDAMH